MGRKAYTILLTMALWLGVVMTPAHANPDMTQAFSMGVFNGTLLVGKVPGICNNTTQTAPSGAGLGRTELKRNKVAHYLLTAALADVPHGQGSLTLCGEVHPAFSLGKAAVGAACDLSSSFGGFGKMDLPGTLNDKKLRDVRWEMTGHFVVISARTSEGQSKKAGGHVRMIAAAGHLCDKGPDPKPPSGPGSGGTNFVVAGAYVKIN